LPTFNANTLPSSTGFDLGSAAQRWDAFLQQLNVSDLATFTGTTTFGLWNGIRVVDGVKFTTAQLAITDAANVLNPVWIPLGQDDGGSFIEPTEVAVFDWRVNNIQSGDFRSRIRINASRIVSQTPSGNAALVDLAQTLTGTPTAAVTDWGLRINTAPNHAGSFGSEFSTFSSFTRMANTGVTPPTVWGQEIQISKLTGIADSAMIGMDITMQKVPALGAGDNRALGLFSDDGVIANVTRAGTALRIGGNKGWTNAINYLTPTEGRSRQRAALHFPYQIPLKALCPTNPVGFSSRWTSAI